MELRIRPTSGFCWPAAARPMSSGSPTMSNVGTASIGMTTAFDRRTAMRSLAMMARITERFTTGPRRER
jgi:hypothetical protein